MSDKTDELSRIAEYCRGVPYKNNSFKCHCPLHQDTNKSLLLSLSHNGNIVANCLAGCNWKDLLDHFKQQGLMSEKTYSNSKEIIVDTYYYTDSIGDTIFEKQRLEPENMIAQGVKRFLYRRKLKNNNKYIYKDVIKSLPAEVKVPLYNLHNIFNAHTVYICEGEKDVKELLKHLPDGNTATCNHDGACKWLPHYNTWLKGKTCIILQDNDESGEKHTSLLTDNLADICKLYLVTFKEYKDVTFPRKYDASDFIKNYGWQELEQYITQNMQLVTSKKKVKEIEREEKQKDSSAAKEEVKKIPRATFDDYVNLIKRTLGTYGKDIFSNKVLTLSDGIWQSAIDLIPIIRSEAAIEEELGLRKYSRPLIEDHFNKWAASLTPRFLIDIPEWDGIDRIRIFSDALNISSNQDFNQDDVDQLLSDWICKAYQRLHDPNIRNRIIILKGGQEIGKDTWIDSLLFGAGQFANTVTTMQHDKDAFLQLSKGMFLKISEFDKTGRTEVSMIKELITIPSTDLRASYDRDFKRRYSRTSFIAACNVDDILRDSTGSTRYIIFEVDSLKRKPDGWHFDFPVRSQHDGLQILAQARHLASINFRASSETEAKLKTYLDNKTPDDPNLDILEAYEELVTQRLMELPLIEQLELRSRGWIDNKHAMKIVREIAERCDMKDRTVRIKLKGLGLGIKSGSRRGFKIIDSTPSIVEKNLDNLSEEEPHF